MKSKQSAATGSLDRHSVEQLAMAIAPAALSQAERESMLSRIMARISVAPPECTYTVRIEEGGGALSRGPRK